MDTLGEPLLVAIGILKPSFSLTRLIRTKLVIVEIKDITNCDQQHLKGNFKGFDSHQGHLLDVDQFHHSSTLLALTC